MVFGFVNRCMHMRIPPFTWLWLLWLSGRAEAFHLSTPTSVALSVSASLQHHGRPSLTRCSFAAPGQIVDRSGTGASERVFAPPPPEAPLMGLTVCVAGAGPSGLLVAHRLAAAGATVRVLEARPRFGMAPGRGRAYALGLGRRGRTALQSGGAELWDRVRAEGCPSERFDLHLPFGLRLRLRDIGDGEAEERRNGDGTPLEPSVLLFQNELCRILADELESRFSKSGKVDWHFDERIQTVDLQKQQVATAGGKTFDFDIVLGCDGVNSVVRQAIENEWEAFESIREPIPGHYKVVRLDRMPEELDPTAVALLLPKDGAITAFVEPTKGGTCCILFAGSNPSDPLLSSSNTTELQELIETRWPKLSCAGSRQAAEQLAALSETSTASLVKCNTFSYSHKAALLGDSAHATGGVSGQGVNSALVDSMVLADMLVEHYDPNRKEESLRKAMLEYSIRQVAEARALYDLSFGPKPKSAAKRILIAVKNLRDSVFKGRFGIGKLPLQTKLTTSLTPFRVIRKLRDDDYEEEFPSDSEWRAMLTKLDATANTSYVVASLN